MLSPSIYETPWETACEVIVYLQSSKHNWDRSQVRSCLAAVQGFLQQTVAFWLEEERRRLIVSTGELIAIQLVEGETCSTNSPRTWICRLVDSLLNPMHSSVDVSALTEHWIVMLDLYPLIVSLSQELDSSLVDDCLDLLFQKPVVEAYIPAWLNISADLSSLLRDRDIRSLQMAIRQALTGNSSEIPQKDILSYVQPVVLLSVSSLSRCCVEDLGVWQELILLLMSVAARDKQTYSAIEILLVRHLSGLSSTSLQHWTQSLAFDHNTTLPRWTYCNLLQLVLRCSRLSGTDFVPCFVARALESLSPDHRTLNLSELCWMKLINCIGPPGSVRSQAFTTGDLLRVFGCITYESAGHFLNKEGARLNFLSSTGTVIYQGLQLPNGSTSLDATQQASERGTAWIHTVIERIKNGDSDEKAWDLSLAVVAVAIVFAEVPSARPRVEQAFIDFLVSDRESQLGPTTVSQVLAIAISLAASNPDTAEALLDSLSDCDRFIFALFNSQLPIPIIFNLVDNLCHHPSARTCMLMAARSSLQVAPSKGLRCGTIGSVSDLCDTRKQQKIGLYCLLSMTSVRHWDECQFNSWSLLFDVIVGSRRIPCECRTWVYKELDHRVQRGQVHRQAALHFLRALVLRLLVFFGASENGIDTFLPGLVFASWSANSDRHFEAVEDICGLFQSVLALLVRSADKEIQSSLRSWRTFVRHLVQMPHMSGTLLKGFSETLPLIELSSVGSGAAFAMQAAMYCMSLIISFANHKISGPLSAEGKLSVDLLRKAVYQEEASSLFDSALPSLRHSIASMSCVNHDVKGVQSMCGALLSPIVLFLLYGNCPTQSKLEIVESTPEISESFILGLAELYSGQSSRNECHPVLLPRYSTLFNVLVAFVPLAIPVIESLLKNRERNFEKLDSILAMTLQLCDLVAEANKTPEDLEHLQSHVLLDTVARVHEAISSEKATLKLIDYLEEAAFYVSGSAKIGRIDTCKDIDCTVQTMRLRVLRSLRACLVASTNPVEKKTPTLFWETETGFCSGGHHAAIGLQCLVDLSDDLTLGVQGKSGGLSYDLFGVYVDCITACSQLLRERLPAKSSGPYLWNVATTAARLSDRLDEVLCMVSLKGSAALRKGIYLVCYELPSVVRRAMLATATSIENYPMDLSEITGTPILRYLEQCRAILDRKIDYDLTNTSGDWKIFADTELFDQTQRSSWKEADELLPSDALDLCSSRSRFALEKESGDRHLQLHSERVWCWAMCSILLSVEDELFETARLLSECNTVFGSARNHELYLRDRVALVLKLSSSIGSFFELIGKESSRSHFQTQLPECMRAVSLPSAVKIRLVAVQERALVVLQKSLMCVSQFIRCPYQAQIVYHVSLIEALAFVTSWLFSDAKFDPCWSILSWIAAERKIACQKEKECVAVLLKLHRAGLRVEQLEGSLVRFIESLLDIKKAKSLCELRLVSEVTRFINLCKIRQYDELDLLDLVSRKAEALETMRFSQAKDFGSNRERGVREKRKRQIRSRNEVIDKWLQQDQSIGNGEALEEDAYADLEDFIDGFG